MTTPDLNHTVRQQLAELGCTFLVCYPGTKIQRKDTSVRRRAPERDALVVLPDDLLVFDADSRPASDDLTLLLEDQPATLEVLTSRGRHVYYRLPAGIRVRRTTGFRPGLDLPARVMAPGSAREAGGVYQANGRPVALLGQRLARDLARELPPRPEPAPGVTEAVFVVQDQDPYSTESRRASARQARQDRRVGGVAPTAVHAAKCHELAQQSRDGGRHRNLLAIASIYARRGEDFAAFYAFVSTQPIRSKLEEKGSGAQRWLERTVWSKAAQPAPGTPRTVPLEEEWADRHRQEQQQRAELWRRGALPVALAACRTPQQRELMPQLVYLHASFSARFGPQYQLAQRVAGDFLHRRGGSGPRLRALLRELGLLRTVRPGGPVQGAETYELIFPVEETSPTPCSNPFEPVRGGGVAEGHVVPGDGFQRAGADPSEALYWLTRPLLTDSEMAQWFALTDELSKAEDARRPHQPDNFPSRHGGPDRRVCDAEDGVSRPGRAGPRREGLRAPQGGPGLADTEADGPEPAAGPSAPRPARDPHAVGSTDASTDPPPRRAAGPRTPYPGRAG